MVTLEEDVTVTRIGNSLRVVIPKTFCKALEINEGDLVRLRTTNGNILLTRPSLKKRG